MAGSRANWEAQSESSFQKSKRDIAKNIAELRKKDTSVESSNSSSPPVGEGLVKKAIGDILGYKERQKKAIEESY